MSFGAGAGRFVYGDTATGTVFALTKNMLSADFSTAETCIDIVREAARDRPGVPPPPLRPSTPPSLAPLDLKRT